MSGRTSDSQRLGKLMCVSGGGGGGGGKEGKRKKWGV